MAVARLRYRRARRGLCHGEPCLHLRAAPRWIQGPGPAARCRPGGPARFFAPCPAGSRALPARTASSPPSARCRLIAQLAVFLGLYVLGYGLMQWHWTGIVRERHHRGGGLAVLRRPRARERAGATTSSSFSPGRPERSPSPSRSVTCRRSTRPSTVASRSSP